MKNRQRWSEGLDTVLTAIILCAAFIALALAGATHTDRAIGVGGWINLLWPTWVLGQEGRIAIAKWAARQERRAAAAATPTGAAP